MKKLSIRLWLVATLVSIAGIPLMAGLLTTFLQRPLSGRTAALSNQVSLDEIVAQARQWGEPAWQNNLQKKLERAGEHIFIIDTTGHMLYTDDPAALAPTASSQPAKMLDQSGQSIVVREGQRYLGTVILSSPHPVAGLDQRWSPPFSALLALILVLLLLAWIIGRAVVRPLAGLGEAARMIAANEMDVRLPCSPVKEIAQVADAFGNMRDALRAALQRQGDLEQERRLFIGAIAHDLRTPLFSLRGYLEAIQTGVAETPEQMEKYLVLSQEKAMALERLIEGLFAYVRLEYLEMPPQLEQVDAGACLRKIVESWQPLAKSKQIELLMQSSPQQFLITCDEHLFTRAVENVLDNALRYTPAGGTVSASWGEEAGRLVFSITDSGPGIAAGDLPRLFVPFYRGETSRNRRTGGVGLGLTIAQRIVNAHGGTLQVNNAPSGGAVFTITLPEQQQPGPEQPA